LQNALKTGDPQLIAREPELARDKVNILMVDDQAAKLLSFEAILGELGENLIKATNAKEALEALLKNDIAVVLMDVSMPDIDGFELADMIRQHPRFQKTAIIFISAIHLTDMDRMQGYDRGGVDYISVPVIPELLRAKVSVFAELHRKTRQLEILNMELRSLSGRLIAMQDDERRRFARELHDGLGQELTAAKMAIDSVLIQGTQGSVDSNRQAIMQASSLVDGAIQQVRSVSHLLHPPLLDEIGLDAALSWYSEGLTKRSGIETSIQLDPRDFPRLTPGLETMVFRIIQEALTNVFRHSGATKCSVSVAKKLDSVSVIVTDNGKGITDDIAAFDPEKIGVGIGGIRQRIKEVGGAMSLRNARPSGAILEAVIPTTAHSGLTPTLRTNAGRSEREGGSV
jgi:signal transduction histidine kinase